MASTTNPPAYLSTFTSYDYADRVSETWSPGGPVTRITYDAVDRQRMTRSLAKLEDGSLVKVSNTETRYDDDNRPFVTIHSERINVANPTEQLDDSSSVRTFTRNWYDRAGRVTDSASFGTGVVDFTYATAEPANLRNQAAEPIAANFPDALLTHYEYDAKGRQVAVHNPGGDVTRTVYDDLGRQRLVIENADAAQADERRITAYDYDDAGRMSRIAAVLPTHNGGAVDEFSDITWTVSDGSLQVTEMIYGATVVTSAAGHAAISENETWIAEVRYPDRQTGQPSSDNRLIFTYYSDGLVASRTDGLGRTFSYAYDDLSRLTEVLVATAAVPVEGNIRIAYTYTAAGQLGTVTAYRIDSSGGSGNTEVVAAQNFFGYDDGFQNLLFERQQLDGVVTSASPTIDYQWDFSGADAGNYHRLAGMTYPTRINGGRRQIDIGYATGTDSAGVDGALGRITSITDQTTNASTSYTYGGMSRRLSMLMACGIGQLFTAGSAVGAPGLDRFGRPMDLHYIGVNAPLPGTTAGTVHRYEYRYDTSGNRTHARVDQQPPNWNGGGGGTGENRSWAYGYDALQRLTEADRGTASGGGNPGDPISLATTDVATDWDLDNLGNWTGVFDPGPSGNHIPGMTITYAPGTANETVDSRTHAVFQDNALESVKTQHGTASPVETAYVVNLVGSTVFDGTYYYEYDAWNRLIRVSDAGTVTAASFDGKGVLLPPATPPNGQGPTLNVPGNWRFQYVYDGLGRLARKESPVTPGNSEARREDYRYDGVRRIQEAVTRWSGAIVIPGGEEQGASGGTNPGEPGEGDPGAVTLGGLEEPVEATELEPFGEGTLLLALPEEWDQREYVWGPDYVDELAFQFDRDGRPLYALLDANYNVMAIIAGGVRPCGNIDADPYDDTVPAGTVLEQYVWSPYGELLALDLLIPLAQGESPRNRAGHQGLFFERFDAKNTDPPLVATDPITGEGKGWYYNRNRWYDATMGRFTTADPNETAMVALSSMAMNASVFDVMLGALSAPGQYGDGTNVFAYAGSNPLIGGDPTGLNWWDDDIDDAIADRTGHAMFMVGTLNEAARIASIGLNTSISIVAGFLPGSGLYDAFKAVGVLASGQGGFWEAMDIAMAALPLAKGLMGLAAMGKARLWSAKACNSFVAGTLIDTPDGPTPIEYLRSGNWVLSRHEHDPEGRIVPRRLSEVVAGSSDRILWLSLDNGVTLGVTDQHDLWVDGRGGTLACELTIGDALTRGDGTIAHIVDIVAEERSTPVFNLEVEGTYTFFAEKAWVHNNACSVAIRAWALRIGKQGSYRDMRKLTKGHGGEIQAHHILESRHGKRWGLNTDSLPAVILTRAEHAAVTRELNAALRVGLRHGKREVWAAYQRVYTQIGKADWLPKIEGYFR